MNILRRQILLRQRAVLFYSINTFTRLAIHLAPSHSTLPSTLLGV